METHDTITSFLLAGLLGFYGPAFLLNCKSRMPNQILFVIIIIKHPFPKLRKLEVSITSRFMELQCHMCIEAKAEVIIEDIKRKL